MPAATATSPGDAIRRPFRQRTSRPGRPLHAQRLAFSPGEFATLQAVQAADGRDCAAAMTYQNERASA